MISAQVMTGERSRAYRRLRRTTAQLERRLAPLELVDVAYERRRRAARDARCAAWLAARLPARAAALEALCGLLEQHRALERSWTFQRALFFEQLRLTGATGGGEGRHEREALSFGTTSFAAFCSLLAAPCLKDARTRGGACVVLGSSTAVWKSKFYGVFVLNRRIDLHAIDATPARWRGDAGSSLLDGASTAASLPRNDVVKNCRVHPTHW